MEVFTTIAERGADGSSLTEISSPSFVTPLSRAPSGDGRISLIKRKRELRPELFIAEPAKEEQFYCLPWRG